ncbi:MAG: ATP-binding protein [Bacteroidetes bacterium]|jgi:nitrogen-specific signal transduction histidine kinase|nr:ATP-binding protein [Bacteroidota bacterium]
MKKRGMVNIYESRRFIKVILMLLALIISIITLYLSQRLVVKIAGEEKKKMEMWAEAESILTDPNSEGDLGFQLRVVQSNTTIPAILVDDKGVILEFVNIDTGGRTRVEQYLSAKLEEFKIENEAIVVPVDKDVDFKVYYGSSTVLTQLQYYPYVVLGIVALFMFVSYVAFSYSTRSEQDKVWVGLAKETAHQLGTPISSLMGWVQVMELGDLPEGAPMEMRKDIDRLNIITERFSKIGSEPVLETLNLNEVMFEAIEYMKNRSGRGVVFESEFWKSDVLCRINRNLFHWVIENLIKNSIDAMEGEGVLKCSVKLIKNKAVVDITDSGKGVSRDQMKSIFKPGFTTKKRGWGLGLSLAKRIITDYHRGEIYVKSSIPFEHTTMRIVISAV